MIQTDGNIGERKNVSGTQKPKRIRKQNEFLVRWMLEQDSILPSAKSKCAFRSAVCDLSDTFVSSIQHVKSLIETLEQFRDCATDDGCVST